MKQGRLTNKRIAIYQRYSTDKQSESSLVDQRFGNEEFIRREGGDLSKMLVFDDPGVSGSDYSRPGLDEMLRLAEARKLDAIVVEDISRLARDEEFAMGIVRRLRDAGVTLYAVSEGIDTSQPSARLTLAIHAVFAAAYVEGIRSDTRRGQNGCVRNGYSVGGRLYGYCSVDAVDECSSRERRKLVVVSKEAAIVVRIFTEYANGSSYKVIASGLNCDQVASPRANSKPRSAKTSKFFLPGWCESTVRALLANSSYIGERTHNKSTWTKVNGKRRARPNDPSEFVKGSCPVIVTRQLWDRVQARRRKVRATYAPGDLATAPARASHPGRATTHLMSGTMVCTCGASMVIVGGSSTKYYGCSNHKKRGSSMCGNDVSLAEDIARGSILKVLARALMSKEGQQFLRARVEHELSQLAKRDPSDPVTRQRHRVSATEHQIEHLVGVLASGGNLPSVRAKLKQLEGLVREQRQSLKRLEADEVKPSRAPTASEVMARATDLERVLSTNPTRGRELLLNLFEERIVLEPEQGVYVTRKGYLPPITLKRSA